MQDQKHITHQQYCDLVTLASISKCDIIGYQQAAPEEAGETWRRPMRSNSVESLIANLTNPASFYWMPEFPGCDVLGLNPDVEADKNHADAIIYAIFAGAEWEENGHNSAAFGRLDAMVKYGIVRLADLDSIISRYHASRVPENMPEHDAF